MPHDDTFENLQKAYDMIFELPLYFWANIFLHFHLGYRLLQKVVTDCILFIQRHLIPRHNFNFLFMIRCCHLQLNKRQQNILLTRGFFATDFVVYTSQWGTKIIIHSFYFLKTAFLDFSRSCEVPSARPELFKALLNRDWKWPHLIKCKKHQKEFTFQRFILDEGKIVFNL